MIYRKPTKMMNNVYSVFILFMLFSLLITSLLEATEIFPFIIVILIVINYSVFLISRLLISSREDESNSFWINSPLVSVFMDFLDNSRNIAIISGLTQFSISLTLAALMFRQLFYDLNTPGLISVYYYPFEYGILIVLVVLNLLSIISAIYNTKLYLTSITYLLTYFFIGWILNWYYFAFGTVWCLLYLIMIKIISKDNAQVIKETPRLNDSAKRIIAALIIVVVGVGLIGLVMVSFK